MWSSTYATQLVPARGQRALDLLARLAADAPTAILLADNHGHYVWANAAASELLGYSKAALLRLFVWDITPADSESDVDVLWRTFLHGSYQCGTYPIRRRSGRRRWVYYFAEPRLFPGFHVSALKATPKPKPRVESR